jgi:hypothetical protein
MINVLYEEILPETMQIFENMIRLFEKIDKWWIMEIDIPTCGDLWITEEEYNSLTPNDVGNTLIIDLLKMMSEIAFNNTSEYLDLFQKVFYKEKLSNG